MGYNAERFFLLVTGTNDRHWIKGKGVNIQPSFISGTFILGYRFNVANNGWLKSQIIRNLQKNIMRVPVN
ncbi:MAG: hypothetical protein IPP46_13465 [Bacteroidetes bacterium]|nr:hypothetical protein [Bacteroidota bacterium]